MINLPLACLDFESILFDIINLVQCFFSEFSYFVALTLNIALSHLLSVGLAQDPKFM
jgi:hypothetical protein